MNETKINAMFLSLQQQNQQLSGQLAEAHGVIAEMEAYIKEKEEAPTKESGVEELSE